MACLSVRITDSCGDALQIKPEQKEIGYLNNQLKSDVDGITMVVSADHPDTLTGIKRVRIGNNTSL